MISCLLWFFISARDQLKPLYRLWQRFRQCVSCWSISQRKKKKRKKKKEKARPLLPSALSVRCLKNLYPFLCTLCTTAHCPGPRGVETLRGWARGTHGVPNGLRQEAPRAPHLHWDRENAPSPVPGTAVRGEMVQAATVPLQSSSCVLGPEALASATESLCLSFCVAACTLWNLLHCFSRFCLRQALVILVQNRLKK